MLTIVADQQYRSECNDHIAAGASMASIMSATKQGSNFWLYTITSSIPFPVQYMLIWPF